MDIERLWCEAYQGEVLGEEDGDPLEPVLALPHGAKALSTA